MERPACIGNDPFCPCQDGDLCHYRGVGAFRVNAHDENQPRGPHPQPAAVPGAKLKPVPVAIQRLMDEVRAGDATPHGLYDRGHNRHNR